MSKDLRRPVRCLALAAALAVSSLATARADEAAPVKTLKPGTLQVCLYSGFAPFASTDKDGNWQGWDVDFLKAFAAEQNLRFEVVPKNFDGIWKQPGSGACDIAGTGISDTKDRRDATRPDGCWSATYYHVLRAFVVRTEDFTRLARVEDLAGKKAIVTQGSTANIDLCYRMKASGLKPCVKADGDHPCPGFAESYRKDDKRCVFIEYPWKKDERNAAADVAWRRSRDDDEGAPFAYGGGYGSVQNLACDSSGGECSYPTQQSLATIWPHCNMTSDGKEYAEPFSFVVRRADTGLWQALNAYIASHLEEYAGTPIPVLSPPCANPPWTPDPVTDKACPR